MIDFLYSLPDLVLVVGAGAIGALVSCLLPRLVQVLPHFAPSVDNTDFSLRLQGSLFTLSALVLAFTLVQAQANLLRVDGLVTAEASDINSLDRLLTRYGDEATLKIRPLLRSYAQSIVTDEWPEMLKGNRSTATRDAYALLSRSIIALDPPPGRQSLIYSEMLKSVESVASSRDARMASALVALPAIYWDVVAFSLLIVLVAGSTIQRTPFRAILLFLQMSVLGAFVGFVFVVDNPLKGQTAVGPQAIVTTIALIDWRDK